MTNETNRSYKAITKEQIDALRKFNHHSSGMIESRLGDYYYDTDIHMMIDNAPSVGNSEPVVYTTQAYIDKCYGSALMEICAPTAVTTWSKPYGDANVPLYTTQQPDRVAELEAKLKEYEADAKRWKAICNLWLMCTELHLTQNEDGGYSIIPVEFVDNILMENIDGNTPDEAINQAMKAGV